MRNRRGLSSVVGIVFFVIAMTTAITYISFSMDTIERFGQSVIVKKSVDIDRANEEFKIVSSEIVNEKFNFTIQNLGTIPIKFTRLYVENKTDSTWTPARYTIDKKVTYAESITNVGQNIPLQALNTESYSMKLMTARGNAVQFFVNSVGTQPLNINLRAFPGTIPTGFQALLVLDVTNNAPNTSTLVNLQPVLDSVETCPSGECDIEYVSGPTPTIYDSLAPGDIASFEWVYTITGKSGDSVDFTASLVGGISEDTATVTVTTIQEAVESGTALTALDVKGITLNDDILIFHQETDNVPGTNNYQMAASTTDGGIDGLRIQLDEEYQDSRPQFWTNSAAEGITVPFGNWNVSMRLQSEAMPTILKGQGESLIFHFEDGDGADPDNSEGNSSRDLEGCAGVAYEVSENNDDAEERKSDGKMYLNDHDLDLEPDFLVGLRWDNINIPQGASIASADIQFTAEDEDATPSAIYTIYGQMIDDAPAFSNINYDISSRDISRTVAEVTWSNVPPWDEGEISEDTRTPDISNIIEEIVGRPGWVSGNAFVIIIRGTDSGQGGPQDRDVIANEKPGDNTAKLTIDLQSVDGMPDWQKSSGPHNSGSYYFDGNDCFRSKNTVDNNDKNHIDKAPDTTALWFKTDGEVENGEQYLVSWENSGSSNDFYKIALGNTGKVVFEFSSDPSGSTKCESENKYDNGKWYHVVATRDQVGTDVCNLYIANTASALETVTSSTSSSADKVVVDGKWHIGSNQQENGKWFKGWIDDVIHWNEKELDPIEASDLSKTNYGTGAHQFSFYLDRTDGAGNFIDDIGVFTDNGIWFQDPKGTDGDDDDSTYGMVNVTLPMPTVGFTAGERMKFTMLYQTETPTWKPLEVDMKVDDEGLNPYSSYLQIQTPSAPFPSYWIYYNGIELKLWFLNLGPNGIWLTSQGTRVTFNDNNSDLSYAGMIHRVNGTNPADDVDFETDSLFIPVNSKFFIWFYEPRTVPSADPSQQVGLVPAGYYKVSVWLSAYDNKGETFARSINLGTFEVRDGDPPP